MVAKLRKGLFNKDDIAQMVSKYKWSLYTGLSLILWEFMFAWYGLNQQIINLIHVHDNNNLYQW